MRVVLDILEEFMAFFKKELLAPTDCASGPNQLMDKVVALILLLFIFIWRSRRLGVATGVLSTSWAT